MVYFVNAFLEVDETSNEETIRLLAKCGNVFSTESEALIVQKQIQNILRDESDETK